MEQQDIKQRMDMIKQKMDILEWDKKHSKANAKDHIYERLKEEYSDLSGKLDAGKE